MRLTQRHGKMAITRKAIGPVPPVTPKILTGLPQMTMTDPLFGFPAQKKKQKPPAYCVFVP
nr:MAG TPA: hypothetical protein [Caudoviricetes sp.]